MKDLFGYEIEERPRQKSNIFACIGATSFALEDRQKEDYYATDPQATQDLLDIEQFKHTILEPCVGGGILQAY
jgi:hypothetical protein